MPTPHGARGGMAFSADELRVLRRALAQALQPSTPTGNSSREAQCVQDVQDLLRLADAVEEAARESGRMRSFAAAELVRYRAALPGSALGYLERLRGALDAGYVPEPDDLAAVRRLRAQPCSPAEERRRTFLLRRCERVAELDVRARLERRVPAPAAPYTPRPRLLALPGGQASGGGEGDKDQGGQKRPRKGNGKERAEPKEREEKRERKEGGQPEREPEKGKGPAPGPGRKVPTPAEIWPPRRRPTPPPDEPRKPAPPAEQRRGA